MVFEFQAEYKVFPCSSFVNLVLIDTVKGILRAFSDDTVNHGKPPRFAVLNRWNHFIDFRYVCIAAMAHWTHLKHSSGLVATAWYLKPVVNWPNLWAAFAAHA